jgi:hypothetical protein
MPALSLKRAKVTRTELTTARHYRTKDDLAELVEVRWHDPRAYGSYWLAIVYQPRLLICRKRTRKAAEKALAARINPTRKGKR